MGKRPAPKAAGGAGLLDLPDSAAHLALSHLSTLEVVRLQATCRQLKSWARDSLATGLTSLVLDAGCELSLLLDDDGLCLLLRLAPRLRVLSVASDADWLSDNTLESLGRHCPLLERLAVPGCPGVSPRGLAGLTGARLAGTLRELDLTSCAAGVAGGGLLALVGAAPNLTSLRLANTSLGGDALVALAGAAGARLRALDVGACAGTREDVLKQIVAQCPGLEELRVHHCRAVSDEGLSHVAQGCRRLQIVDAAGCRGVTDTALIELASNCPELRVIQAGSTRWITDEGLQAVAEKGLPLEELHLHACVRVTDAGIRSIAMACPRLRRVNFVGMVLLTDGGLRSLADHAQGLEDISVGSALGITDDGLAYMAAACGGTLRSVSCANTGVTSAGLDALAQACPGLTHLNCSRCKGVTDAGIKALAQACPGLRHVNAATCRLTGLGVRALAVCQELRTVDVTACRIPLGLGAPPGAPLQAAVEFLTKKCKSLAKVESDFSLSFWQRDFSAAHAVLIARRANIRKGVGKL